MDKDRIRAVVVLVAGLFIVLAGLVLVQYHDNLEEDTLPGQVEEARVIRMFYSSMIFFGGAIFIMGIYYAFNPESDRKNNNLEYTSLRTKNPKENKKGR
ncbi:MAG: hypothetical protein R6U17_04945 [Thermoplasmata archaeon]